MTDRWKGLVRSDTEVRGEFSETPLTLATSPKRIFWSFSTSSSSFYCCCYSIHLVSPHQNQEPNSDFLNWTTGMPDTLHWVSANARNTGRTFYAKTCGGKIKKEKAIIYRNLYKMMDHSCFIRLLSHLRAKYPLKYNLMLDGKLFSASLLVSHLWKSLPDPMPFLYVAPPRCPPQADILLPSLSLENIYPTVPYPLAFTGFSPMNNCDFFFKD